MVRLAHVDGEARPARAAAASLSVSQLCHAPSSLFHPFETPLRLSCAPPQGMKDPPFPRPFPMQLHQFKSDGPEVWNLRVYFPGALRVPEGYEETPEEVATTWGWNVRATAARLPHLVACAIESQATARRGILVF